MQDHHFLLQKEHWIGEGTITFSSSSERLHFYTHWQVDEMSDGVIAARQKVEMQGTGDLVMNIFNFSNVADGHFTITLQNDLLGKTFGTGVIDTKTIAWEFREHSNFEGFEVYEKQDGGDYEFHAEYASPDQFRTIIDGRIWIKLQA